MGFKTLEEMRAYNVTREFKLEVYRLLDEHPRARESRRFVDQLTDAVASAERNIAEGFGRFSMGEFAQYLRVARGSVREALTEIQDGIDRRYFPAVACTDALALGRQSLRLITALLLSLKGFVSPRSPIQGPPESKPRSRNTPRATTHGPGEPDAEPDAEL